MGFVGFVLCCAKSALIYKHVQKENYRIYEYEPMTQGSFTYSIDMFVVLKVLLKHTLSYEFNGFCKYWLCERLIKTTQI